MRHSRIATASIGLVILLLSCLPASTRAAGHPMRLVGTLAPWPNGQYSNVAADASRHVAYLGSYDDQGVAVIDTRDPAHPILAGRLSTHITSDQLTSDSADLDRVGRYLAVSHQAWSGRGAFEGISIYDIDADPYHPVLVRRIAIPGGVHTVQLDPEAESGRPFAYANSAGNWKVTIADISSGQILSQYASGEGIPCTPFGSFCVGFNFAHEGFVQRHPRSGRVLDYVSYWDSGLRIVDVTDPTAPVEKGAYDYDFFTNGLTSAHYAAATPSGDWVYLEDEIGLLESGGVHVLDASACDGSAYCTPLRVGEWHIAGHEVQAAAINGVIHSGNFNNSFFAAFKRAYTYDAHNLDLRGENELLVANYTMGIRLVDTSDKTAPVEAAFYLPNANESDACKQQDCGFNARNTWGSYFGSDGRIYASDFTRGFFIVEEVDRPVAPPVSLASSLAARAAGNRAGSPRLRALPGGADFAFSLTMPRGGAARIEVYDIRGRLVDAKDLGTVPAGTHTVSWTADRGASAKGIYLAKLKTEAGRAAAKFVH
jgi:hypothetical protein